jgi:photosystem II stability/assembly factor-like uncharacterized protein
MKNLATVLVVLSLLAAAPTAQPATGDDESTRRMSGATFKGLELRGIGPAIASGRVADFAVTPGARHRYFVAVASGGVWKTENAGTTWQPVFDDEGSYSIGCLAMDPSNPNVLWVGTGENNSQRSVSFGDGVYKTLDGGTTWTNLGLKDSEHIGMIAIDPRDTDVVYVAAQGPLWRAGGDRGLYKTTDGGTTWDKILDTGEDTGVSEIHLDPRDPDTLYAAAYQRRRRVWTLINGGPESGLYKSTDGGGSWRELTNGLPEVDLGRIGVAVSPADPDVIYAIVEAARGEGGVFRSTDRGENWAKRSDYMSTSPQYYNELVADPQNVDRVYSLDTRLHVSVDGGATFERVGEEHKHVDNHALWIDPDDPDYLLAGCDGGVYESFDRGATWLYRENLPVTQFYRVTVDTTRPFYWIYGGTQDNNTLGGPVRTLHSSGISNEDWIVTVGGDGYETQVDPTDPNILYSESQYGGLVRYDKRSGEVVRIQPQEEPGEDPHRWNWDAPLMISPHSPTRLYFACQRLYRSDDRGNSWRAVSPDLTRQLDRDSLPVMGRVWSWDAVSKNRSTSAYGNIVSLTESPLVEDLVYVGTDDGLIQISEDGGGSWRRVDRVPGVPDRTYVSRLEASRTDPDTVYAAFDNHKSGDFTPYVFKSSDRGRTWSSIRGDLPDREVVYALAQDHENPKLLFAGTEFGLYFTIDEGAHWIPLEGGFPTIQVRDLEIHRGMNDLAVATFGRGFYVLDDYTPLRTVSERLLESEPVLFPIRDTLLYIQSRSRHMSRGHGFWTAPNPPFGATATYHLPERIRTRAEQRRAAEVAAEKSGSTAPYPTVEEIRAEHEEREPGVFLVIRDEFGTVVRRVPGERAEGLHRVTWDLRFSSCRPADPTAPPEQRPSGRLAPVGRYSATIERLSDGRMTALTEPRQFEVTDLGLATFGADDHAAEHAFDEEVAELRRAVHGAIKAAQEATERLAHLRAAALDTPMPDHDVLADIHRLEIELDAILLELRGDPSQHRYVEPRGPSIRSRIDDIATCQWNTTSSPTQTQRTAYGWAGEAFEVELSKLHEVAREVEALEQRLEAAGAPWTPGRIPTWTPGVE